MIFDAAVIVQIDANDKEEASSRLLKVLNWAGFQCQVITVRTSQPPNQSPHDN